MVGISIERKVEKITESKEPITDGAPLIYTERKEGVIPAYDVRTDRFEIAVEAMGKVVKSNIAKREQATNRTYNPQFALTTFSVRTVCYMSKLQNNNTYDYILQNRTSAWTYRLFLSDNRGNVHNRLLHNHLYIYFESHAGVHIC